MKLILVNGPKLQIQREKCVHTAPFTQSEATKHQAIMQMWMYHFVLSCLSALMGQNAGTSFDSVTVRSRTGAAEALAFHLYPFLYHPFIP